MKKLDVVLLLAGFILTAPTLLRSQTPRWESMDGPYRTETRTHLRFPDGDKRFYGSCTGVHQSPDGGNTWELRGTAPAKNMVVFQSPTGKLIGHSHCLLNYGEAGFYNCDSVFTSSDRGEHWILSRKYLKPLQSPFSNAFGNGDTVYQTEWRNSSGTLLWILRSTDGGESWLAVLRAASTPGLPSRSFLNVYTQPGNVFATVEGSLNFEPQVMRSTDGGTNWQAINAAIVMFHPPNHLLRLRNDWADGSPSTYAFIEHSTDNGTSWTRTLAADSGFASLVSNNVSTLFVLRKPGNELCRSTDGGATWTVADAVPPSDPLISVSFYGRTHAVGRTSSDTFYRSADFGATWSPIQDLSGARLAGMVQPASDSLLVVSEAKGNWIESTDGGGTWRSIICPFDKEQVASLLPLPSGSLFAGTITGLSKKTGEEAWSEHNGGPVWSLWYSSGPLFFAGYGGSNIWSTGDVPVACAIDTSIVPSIYRPVITWVVAPNYEARNCQHFLTTSSGSVLCICDYSLYSSLVPGSGEIVYLNRMPGSWLPEVPSRWSATVEDSTHAIWAANDSAGLFKATNPGDSLTASNIGLTSKNILSMAVARNGYLYAGSRSAGLFRSTDNGATWHASGLTGERVQVLTVGKGSEVYVGTPNGVRASADGGLSWTDLSTGLGSSDIRALAVGPDGTVYCGTWGEGVYRLVGAVEVSTGRPGPELPGSFALEQNYPNPFNPRTVVRSQTPEVSNVRIVIYDLLGREVAVLVNERRAAGRYQDAFDARKLSSGIYMCRMTAGPYVHSMKMLLVK